MLKRLMLIICLATSLNCIAQTASNVGTNVQPVVSASGVSAGTVLSGPNSVSYIPSPTKHVDNDTNNKMIAEVALLFLFSGLLSWLILADTDDA